ncbi:hypothetical protein MSSAC_0571 [Methanosarcina siciliae C2J]|uniref:Uncharacterized protein n=3 Tax=Methanosarcina siciliae TaxID=38027 RepID=A0A0E3LA11_9EURY|nr:hypothetical protein [Methanosarcina siciliae]AKB27270.1 hypothetical protein MSSIT_0551 [Methanosarcina siciliae T4/M]AKB31211.1 hypothetical protein MSSIH_0521 [Methanosarcina siciliae HI350]AKB35161.1 hypothetical protein MSSAC_0571 [Methanosarcina siciliae C2J]
MADHPEIKIGQARIDLQINEENSEKAYERKAEEQEKSGKEPNKGVSSEEFCISCMDIPEEQRKGITLEIQQVAERLLKAHGVINEPGDLLKGEWFLKLQKPKFEKKLVLAKSGEEVFIGFYSYKEETPVPDPNFVLLSQYSVWYPQRVEEKFEETVASFFTGAYGDYDFLNIVPENVEKFQAFQRDFAKMLEDQGWDGPEVEVVEKIMPKD